MTADFKTELDAMILSGASVSTIERRFGISNRNVRRRKSELYESGALPKPEGMKPKAQHASRHTE
jgi:transposase-like protein